MSVKPELRNSSRLPYSTEIYCSKCICEGKITVYELPLELKVVNVSREGLCITTEVEFKEGAFLEFDITLEDEIYKSVSAIILWIIKDQNNYKYGMRINNITGKLSRHIYKMENRFLARI
ncbi:PilZ domain-containing protein [Desulfosporosinus sp. FKA]|uniref:PilZ domain-containing protein n=1 Tax=Desulfosporosinus sp. FKA TaxID=1969834 RepID=UPI000B49CCDF|nr:PilZ domain-containing protein [Desulfosporosinus sp. FKA]